MLCSSYERPGDIQFLLNGDPEDNVCDGCAAECAPDLYTAVSRLHDAGWQGIQDDRVWKVLGHDGPLPVERIISAAQILAPTERKTA